MAERLGFEIFADDKASEGLTKAGASLKRLAADVELAQARLAKATLASTAAVEKFGSGSIQAREAAAKLAIAEDNVSKASAKMAAGHSTASVAVQETKKSFSELHPMMAKVATTAAGMWGSQAVTAGLQRFHTFTQEAMASASELNESMNAVDKTFGTSNKTIKAWGETSAASYGMSQSAFQSMATPLGSMLKNAGISMQDTARWTIDLTKRAADMASVFNTSVPDALEAINAGLRGESDPLERYGVGLSAAKVEAQAMAATHKSAASQLTSTELATARLNLIMQQTAQTEGDFTSTSDQFANAQRRSAAEMENAKAKLGQDLLPIMAKVSSTTASVVSSFASLPEPVQAATIATVAFGGAALMLVPKLASAKAAVVELGIVGETGAAKLGKIAGALGVVGATMTALSLGDSLKDALKDPMPGLNTTVKDLEKLAATGERAGPVVGNVSDSFETLAQSVAGARGWLEQMPGFFDVESFAGFKQSIDDSKKTLDQLDQALAQQVQSGKVEAAAEQFRKLGDIAKQQGMSIGDMTKLFPQYRNALDGVTPAANNAAQASDKLTVSTDGVKDAALRQAEAQKRLKDSLIATNNTYLELSGSEISYWSAVDSTTEAVKQNGHTLDVHTEKGRANKTALDGLASSSLAYLNTMMQQSAPSAQFNAQLDRSRENLQQAAIRFGMTRAEAQAYTDKILAIPHVVNTSVGLNINQPMQAIDTLNWRLNQINGKTVTAYVKTETEGSVAAPRGVVAGRAAGGILPGVPSHHDNMLIAAASGEFVVNAQRTSQYRGVLEAINSGTYRGYATGGLVKSAAAARVATVADTPPVVVHVSLDGQPFRSMVAAATDRQAWRATSGRR